VPATLLYFRYDVSGGNEDLFWGGDNSHSVQIVADKKTYHPGETAEFLIVTGKANTRVWVTVERVGISAHSNRCARKRRLRSLNTPYLPMTTPISS
jgi:uncharacterized protein YfaS (alpha-2-macroglobulin family)